MERGINSKLFFLILIIASCQINKENESNQVAEVETKDSNKEIQRDNLLVYKPPN
ncbi:MAG: hypothetical protein ACI85O_003276 [Saprospiraceae bacterium]|jgi:hypothetical protein